MSIGDLSYLESWLLGGGFFLAVFGIVCWLVWLSLKQQGFLARQHAETKVDLRYKVKVFQLSKIGSSQTESEDAVFISSDTRQIAVADGVSQSFAAQIWAKFVVKSLALAKKNEDLQTLISSTATEWHNEVDKLIGDEPSWNIKKKFDSGAQATFVLITLSNNQDRTIWQAQMIGDCAVIQITSATDEKERFFSYPANYAELSGKTPETVSSRIPYVRGTIADISGELTANSRLLLLTDALAKYVLEKLSHGNLINDILPFLETEYISADLYFEEWANGLRPDELEDDDLTLVDITYG